MKIIIGYWFFLCKNKGFHGNAVFDIYLKLYFTFTISSTLVTVMAFPFGLQRSYYLPIFLILFNFLVVAIFLILILSILLTWYLFTFIGRSFPIFLCFIYRNIYPHFSQIVDQLLWFVTVSIYAVNFLSSYLLYIFI